MENIVKVNVNKDILNFLKGAYFEKLSAPIWSASTRAYLDMNRTIRFNELSENDRLELRKEVKTVFERINSIRYIK